MVILTSLITSFVIMTAGYGYWTEELTIKGKLTLKEDSEVITNLENALSNEQNLLEKQKLQLEKKIFKLQELEEKALKEMQNKQVTEANNTKDTIPSESREDVIDETGFEENKAYEPEPEEDTSYEDINTEESE